MEEAGRLKDALETKYGKLSEIKKLADFYVDYNNGDIIAGRAKSMKDFIIKIKGIDAFLKAANDKAFATEDSIEKPARLKGLKNL
jgi:hypothetical protein